MKKKTGKIGMLLVFLILLMVGLAGCGLVFVRDAPSNREVIFVYASPPAETPIRTIGIWIDARFGEADLIEIYKAIGRWNLVLNGFIDLKVISYHSRLDDSDLIDVALSGGWLFLKVDGSEPGCPRIGDIELSDGGIQKLWAIGYTERVGGSHLHLVRERLRNEDVFGVTLHEMGHLLGSDHVGKRLMAARFNRNGYRCVDYDTILAVEKAQKLPMGSLNYCL